MRFLSRSAIVLFIIFELFGATIVLAQQSTPSSAAASTAASTPAPTPDTNPLCWKEEDCAKARAAFHNEVWLELTPEQQKQEEGGFVKDPATCGDTMGRCLPAGLTETEISFGGNKKFSSIGDFITKNYQYAIGVAGILAAMMLVVAGFQWVTSGGNSEAITSAKKRIGGSIVGLFIAYMSYFILTTVNPATVNLRLPQTWMVRGEGQFQAPTYDQCDPVEGSVSRKACEAQGKICQPGPGYRGDMGLCTRIPEFVGALGLSATLGAGGAIAKGAQMLYTAAAGQVATGAAIAAAHPIALTALGGVTIWSGVKLNNATGGLVGQVAKGAALAPVYAVTGVVSGAYDSIINGEHVGVCITPATGLPPGTMCDSKSPVNQCATGKCVPDKTVSAFMSCISKSTIGFCSDGKNGASCDTTDTPSDCDKGLKCIEDPALDNIQICTDGKEGSACAEDSDCSSISSCPVGSPCVLSGTKCSNNVCTAAAFTDVSTGQLCQQSSNCGSVTDKCIVISQCGENVGQFDHSGQIIPGFNDSPDYNATTWSGGHDGAVGVCEPDLATNLQDVLARINDFRKLYKAYGMRYCAVTPQASFYGGCESCTDVDGVKRTDFAPHLQ